MGLGQGGLQISWDRMGLGQGGLPAETVPLSSSQSGTTRPWKVARPCRPTLWDRLGQVGLGYVPSWV